MRTHPSVTRGTGRGRGVVAVAVAALVLAGAATPAAAAPTDSSESAAQLVDGDLLGTGFLTAVTTQAGNPSDAGPRSASIDAGVLGGLATVSLGSVSVPLVDDGSGSGLLDLGGASGAGLLNGYAAAPNPYQATAASGAVGDDGSIDLSGVADPADTDLARVNLQPLLAQLGVAGLTDAVVDDLSLGLGALASTATATGGGTPSSDYVLAGAELTVSSPLVAGLTGELGTAVGDVDAAAAGLLGPGGPVQDALDGLAVPDVSVPGVVTIDLGTPTVAATVDLSGVLAGVLADPVLTDGPVTIDLTTGLITVDLAELNGGTLNGLPANTALLTSAQITAITDTVAALLGDLTGTVTDAVDAALRTTSVTIALAPSVTALAGVVTSDLAVQVDTTVGDLLDGTVADDDVTVTGGVAVDLGLGSVPVPIGDIVDALLPTVLGTVVPAVGDVLEPALGAGGALVESTVGGVVDGVVTGLDPVLDGVLAQAVALTVNSQPSPGTLGTGSFTVRPLLVELLPGTPDAVSLALASSSVRVPAVAPPVPTVTGVDPTTGPTSGGTTVTITGTGLDSVDGVTFGGVPGTGLVAAPGGGSLVVVTPPAEAGGTVPIVLEAIGGDVPADGFTYVAPTITGVDPASGPEAGGTTVTITGSGLTGATGVTFGGTGAAAVTVVDDSTITASSPAGTGVVDVAVVLPGADAVAPGAFTYVPPGPPTVTSVEPDQVSTAGGTVVTVTGSDLGGATGVTFDGAPGTDVVVSPDGTTITVLAPPSEDEGPADVVVVLPGGTVPAGTVTYVAPTIGSVAPDRGPTSGGTAVTITGTDLGKAQGVLFGAAPGTGLAVASGGGSLTIVTPPGTPSTVDVTVVLPGVDAVAPGAFTYVPTVVVPTDDGDGSGGNGGTGGNGGGPDVDGVTPGSGPTAGGTTVTVTGDGFVPGQTTVTICGAVLAPSTVSVQADGRSLMFTSPACSAGTQAVTVTTPAGSDAGQFRYVDPSAGFLARTGPGQAPAAATLALLLLLAGASAVVWSRLQSGRRGARAVCG